MTKEEVLEKFKDVELLFSYYYKYRFYFECILDDYSFVGTYGGCHEYIYKTRISNDDSILLKEFAWELDTLQIKEGNKQVFFWEELKES